MQSNFPKRINMWWRSVYVKLPCKNHRLNIVRIIRLSIYYLQNIRYPGCAAHYDTFSYPYPEKSRICKILGPIMSLLDITFGLFQAKLVTWAYYQMSERLSYICLIPPKAKDLVLIGHGSMLYPILFWSFRYFWMWALLWLYSIQRARGPFQDKWNDYSYKLP